MESPSFHPARGSSLRLFFRHCMTVILAATLTLLSFPPLASCSSESEDVLGEDSLNVVFNATSVNGSGFLQWTIADYANDRLVKTARYAGSYHERLDVTMRTGRHHVVFFCASPNSSCSFVPADATIFVNTSSDTWMRDIWDTSASTIDVTISKEAARFDLTTELPIGYLNIYPSDINTWPSTISIGHAELSFQGFPCRLSLLDDCCETSGISVSLPFAPPYSYIPILTPTNGLSGVAVTIQTYDRSGTLVSTRHISHIPVKRREPTFLVGPLLSGSDKDWRIFEAKDSLEMYNAFPWL